MAWWKPTTWFRGGASIVRTVRAKFDSAQTTPDNRRHWANADGFSADVAASPAVRQTLRNRARYEVANNSYARGIVLTLANDVIGTGPRLQMLLGTGEDGGAGGVNGFIEREFSAWCREVDLPGKLRTMRMARAQDGEAFGWLFFNAALGTPVKLDIRLIEADQVTTPTPAAMRRGGDGLGENMADGIEFDFFGNPAAYHVLMSHPGGGGPWSVVQEFERVPAANMIHWFRADRPGQHRGLPDILPALPLFAQLRRYTLAVIAAAESAANVAIFMKTNTPAGGEAAEVAPKTEMEFTPNMAVFGPEGWEPIQIKAEQPATSYAEFKREILNEIARCLNMPYNVAACNSSGYNYSSGRLDHQTYHKSVRVEQDHLEDVVLDRILYMWLAEAATVYPELAALRRPAANASVVVNVSPGVDVLEGVAQAMPHQWFWDGREHIDPAKEANAQATRLANNTTTLATEFAKQGKDWETEVRQRAREVTLCRTLGLTLALPAPQPAADTPTQDTQKQ
ncbi:MAG: phage portal protein, partial [Phycisphaerae bacterium]|nr:phage portal protein [Phycisphaerae bacterium]